MNPVLQQAEEVEICQNKETPAAVGTGQTQFRTVKWGGGSGHHDSQNQRQGGGAGARVKGRSQTKRTHAAGHADTTDVSQKRRYQLGLRQD